MSRVLVCGGREYADHRRVFAVLDRYRERFGVDVVIHGAARGADTIADAWAAARDVPALDFPADWNANGKGAGPIRNQRMLDEGMPDVVIAFRGGNGTADMIRRAKTAGVTVHQIQP